jgi:hypothetical protein
VIFRVMVDIKSKKNKFIFKFIDLVKICGIERI